MGGDGFVLGNVCVLEGGWRLGVGVVGGGCCWVWGDIVGCVLVMQRITYYIPTTKTKKQQVPTFFPGRQAEIFIHKGTQRIGVFGIVHPDVLAAYDIKYPTSALELDIEPFCHDQLYKQLPSHFPTNHT